MAEKCTVREGKFVVACESLAKCTDNIAPGFSKARRISRWSYSNFKTHEATRTFYGVKCDAYPNGFLFNFCPFCGEKIDAPFAEQDDDAARKDASA